MRCSPGKKGKDRAEEHGQKEYRSKCSLIMGNASTSASLECRAQARVERDQK